jgi:glycine/D-amino acid oxidase-like deaminating enzyme
MAYTATSSTWLRGINKAQVYPTLDKDATADVVIVGAGVAGTMAAYLLAKAGKKVILLDKNTIEYTTTAYTTGFITYILDTGISELVDMYGKANATKIWESSDKGIDLIEKIVKDEKIECEFKRVPEFVFATSNSEWKGLEDEKKAADKVGFNSLKLHKKNTLPFKNSGAMEVPNQAKFHAIKFVIGLRKAAAKLGVEIHEQTEATRIVEDEKRVVVRTKHTGSDSEATMHTVTAKDVVVMTYQPFNNPFPLFAHKGMYMSYVLELEIPSGAIAEGLYIDEQNPYHYFRIDAGLGASKGTDRMIIGGEDQRSEIPHDPRRSYTAIEEYLADILPNLKYKIVTQWDGGILESIDGLPYIGRWSKDHPHHYVATAFSGNGMQFSAVAGTIIRDLITGKDNPYAKVYDASRPTSIKNFGKKFIDFGEEFFGGAVKNALRKKSGGKK